MPTEIDPIRKAQSLAVHRIARILEPLMDTPDEILLSLAELPCRGDVPLEEAEQHVKDAAVRFQQIARLFLNLKKEIKKLHPDAH